MYGFLTIITITKDDLEGAAATIASTRKLRACPGVKQIIIDGSSNSIREKVQALVIDEFNVEYQWQKPQGISRAFNQGISSSKCEWVLFLNGRDQAHPDLDASLLMQFLRLTDAEIVICQMESMQSGVRHKRPPLWALWPPMYWIHHPATLVKRRLFDMYGLFSQDYNIAMDGELWVRFFTKDISVDMVSMPLSLFDQNGISSTDLRTVEREADKIILSNFITLSKLWLKSGLYLLKALKHRIM